MQAVDRELIFLKINGIYSTCALRIDELGVYSGGGLAGDLLLVVEAVVVVDWSGHRPEGGLLQGDHQYNAHERHERVEASEQQERPNGAPVVVELAADLIGSITQE